MSLNSNGIPVALVEMMEDARAAETQRPVPGRDIVLDWQAFVGAIAAEMRLPHDQADLVSQRIVNRVRLTESQKEG